LESANKIFQTENSDYSKIKPKFESHCNKEKYNRTTKNRKEANEDGKETLIMKNEHVSTEASCRW
jgi:hypothetical protein